jgi:hypothetical protein
MKQKMEQAMQQLETRKPGATPQASGNPDVGTDFKMDV